ncbi:MAG: ATP-binding protein [Clostridiales bacterium]|nr:ATP-binding protein [Clostridiales bacterium]
MDLFIFDSIEQDSCIEGILKKNNTEILKNVVRFAETEGVTDSSLREYVAALLANSKNILSDIAQAGGSIGDDLYRVAMMDMEQIYKRLFSMPMKYSPSGNDPGFSKEYKESIRALTEAKDSGELLDRLIMHYRRLGCGNSAKYVAFKYEGELIGISDVDDQTFDTLLGIDYQKNILIDNTKALLAGKRANNVLLFGDRGTGKSSSVKALLNMFASEGLRLVEVPKTFISKIPHLSEELSKKPNKYILFLDDLSFESHDNEYKALKVAMEGQLRAHSDNVIIYATSNRRHLIKETVGDRQGSDFHVNDNIQETLSLSERFGISLVFSSPNQKEYLNIVKSMLLAHGIEMDGDIEKQALVWQMNYGSRSGRCAKQFVAGYIAKQGG